jgi:hypothetical protein
MFEILNTSLHVIIVIHVYQVYTKKILQTLSYIYIYNLPLIFFFFLYNGEYKITKIKHKQKNKKY